MLVNAGFSASGNQILYNGMTGEQLFSDIYIGPTYYMRLKHMVKDKINYRARGPITMLTRQTVQGRANDGGLRIGEMERDGVMAHGASAFLNESFMIRGDEYYMAVCNKTGGIAIYNQNLNLFLSPFSDGPVNFNTTLDGKMNIKNISRFGRSFSIVRVPYAFKLMIQELQAMNIQMRIITEDNIDQLLSMSYSDNINKLLKNNNTIDQIALNYKRDIYQKINNTNNTNSKKIIIPSEKQQYPDIGIEEKSEISSIPYAENSPAYSPPTTSEEEIERNIQSDESSGWNPNTPPLPQTGLFTPNTPPLPQTGLFTPNTPPGSPPSQEGLFTPKTPPGSPPGSPPQDFSSSSFSTPASPATSTMTPSNMYTQQQQQQLILPQEQSIIGGDGTITLNIEDVPKLLDIMNVDKIEKKEEVFEPIVFEKKENSILDVVEENKDNDVSSSVNNDNSSSSFGEKKIIKINT